MHRVILKPRKALPFFSGHPWVFAGAIARIDGEPDAGAEVALYSDKQEFIARGLFNPHSNIRVRLYAWDGDTPLDEDFWFRRIDAAVRWREKLFPSFNDSTACRLIFSEADQLSGLTVDRYGPWLLVQLTSRALAERKPAIIEALRKRLKPRGLWFRTEKGIGAAEGLVAADGLLVGEEPPRPVFIEEHGIRYGVDVVQGQKTGFYLDQRDNRKLVAELHRGPRVLDLFCYTGGFGLNLIRHAGADEVVAVDSSEPALATARANAELNELSTHMRFVKADARQCLADLKSQGELFDTVIVDPPKFARTRGGLNRALRAYADINELALAVLKPDGLLATFSCSGLVAREDFEQVLAAVAARAHRPIQIVRTLSQASDHPTLTACFETAYLKGCLCRVG